jgi:D-alanyl-D-alanine carboxypeptidase
MTNKTRKIFFFSFLPAVFCCLLFFFSPAQAAEEVAFDSQTAATTTASAAGAPVLAGEPAALDVFSLDLNKETIAKGYTVSSFGGSLKLSLAPGILSESTRVDCEIIGEEMPLPWKLEKLSKIYQFEFRNKAAYDNSRPFYIQISYDKKDAGYKRVFFYDKNYSSWRELPTVDYPEGSFVRSLIHLPFARLAVFSDPSVMTLGRASWYAYKGGNFAASPDFPKGSKLRVYNLANRKSVDVVVNDYGPERNKHPDRAIDLDKIAFKKIASLSGGIINVKIEPLAIVPDARGRVLGTPEQGALSEPDIKAAAAIAMNEKNGEIVWEKNSSAVLPLASLSKLVAIKIFFDLRLSLNTAVTYQKQDELYNYKYCQPYESAKLEVKEGETMTVEDLVYSSLVGSANNAVESLVRVSGISRDEFIAAMNDYAASIGALSTRFIEPTGLAQENVSTAKDYALITGEIFKNPLIEKISVTPRYKFSTINTKISHTLSNTNNFIRDGVFAAANNLKITGSKTGYLDKYNLMTRTAGANGEKIIVVTLGADSKLQSLEETKELIQYGMIKIK